jgi:hypothetical protein
MTIKPHSKRIQFIAKGSRERADFKALVEAPAQSFIEFEAPDYAALKAKTDRAAKKFAVDLRIALMSDGNMRVSVL